MRRRDYPQNRWSRSTRLGCDLSWFRMGQRFEFQVLPADDTVRSVEGRSIALSRWRFNASSSPEASDENVELVISGSIRTSDKGDTLSVELSMSGSEIMLDADGSELGRWDATAVVIRQIDATKFEFIAEGDRLIFMPDNPAAFGIIPFGGGHDSIGGRRKGRRAKQAKEETGGSDALATPESSPRTSTPEKAPKVEKSKVRKAKGAESQTPGAWLRTLDTARRHDFPGLDRVPVDARIGSVICQRLV